MSKIKFIVSSIKEGRLIRNIIFRHKHKRLIDSDLPDKEYLIKMGKLRMGYIMNLDNPTTFNEKLNWYKLNYCTDLMKKVVDKIEVKQYIIEKGLKYILIPTIKEYESVDDIILSDLPNQFVVKNTMDSGGVYVCKDKSKTSIGLIKEKIRVVKNFSLKTGKHVNREPAYISGANRILVEELLNTQDGHAPWDYKFFCFNGEPKFLFVGSDRDTNVCFDFFDIDFNWLDVRQGHPHSKHRIEKPKNYDRMLEICRILSKDFPHVRVDLYNIDGKIYFGELTFYHFAGLTPFKPQKWDKIFGDYWDISTIK